MSEPITLTSEIIKPAPLTLEQIAKLRAALLEFREAYENGGFVKHGIMERHADALRIAREVP